MELLLDPHGILMSEAHPLSVPIGRELPITVRRTNGVSSHSREVARDMDPQCALT